MFKRYIKKHGKKLGPYYYENIRSGDGKVKAIYIGTNPQHHPKHRIRKPLFFLILALLLILVLGSALFLMQNKSYLISKVRLQEPDFDVDQILLKVLIKSGEFIEKQARVMNTGSSPSIINAEVLGLEDIVHVNPSSFTIKPGQTKIVALNFSSFIPEQKIEQQPGVYVGRLFVKSEKAAKEIPIIVEIESKNVLFDMNLNPVSVEKKVERGSDATIEVRLFNLQSIESASVDVEYTVKDINGNTITTESETVVAKTQASFFKKISIPKSLKPGPYVFSAQSRFGSSTGTSSYLFEVTAPEAEASFAQFCKNSIMCLGLSLTTILLLFALAAYFYFFIGAYLYGKVTGAILIPKKKGSGKQISEKPSKLASVIHSLMDEIRRKRKQWKLDYERKIAEQERISEEERLKRVEEERASQLEAKRKRLEEERRYQEELKKDDELRREREAQRKEEELEKEEKERQEKLKKLQELKKQKELEIQEKIKREEELRKQKEIEEKRRIELQKQQESMQKQKEIERKAGEAKRKRLLNERKKQVKEFFHKIGFYKTHEEKKAIALQKEKERQENLRKLQEAKRQKEIEEKRKQEELKKNEALRREKEAQRKEEELEKEEKERQEKIKREEELRKQKEIEEKRRIELQKQQEIERKKAETEKDNILKEAEAKLSEKNKRHDALERELKTLNSEKSSLENTLGEINKKIGYAENEIANKTGDEKELAGQKDILSKKFKNEKTDSLQSKKKEIAERLAAKQEQLSRELEEELGKLSPKQRESAEKWKKLEAKAKLNIEKQNLEDELDRHKLALSEKNKKLEEEYQTKVSKINKKQKQLKAELEELESRKRQLSAEKTGIKAEIAKKEDAIGNTASKLEGIKTKRSELSSKLLKIKQETRGRKWGWLDNLMHTPKEKAQKALKLQNQKEAPKWNILMPKPKAEFEEKTAVGSKKLEEFYKSLNQAEESIDKNDMAGAKKLYTAARNAYLELDYEERKKVYSELMNFYNRLNK